MINMRKMKFNKTAGKLFLLGSLALMLPTLCSPALANPSESIQITNGTTISESESNDINAQDLSNYYDLENDKIDVLINGNLSSSTDTDKYSYYSISGNNIKLQCNLKDIPHNDITSICSGKDVLAFVTDNNTIWEPIGGDVVKITDDIEIASEVDGLELEDIFISDICVNNNEDIIIALSSDICTINTDLDISMLYDQVDIETATGITNPSIGSVVIYENTIYFTDLTSLTLLKGDISKSQLTIVADSYDLLAALTSNSLVDITPTTIAQTTETFRPTYMIKVSGSDTYTDGFYISQFSSVNSGTGQINLFSPDDDTQTSFSYSTFMEASDDIINPTCLAIATSNDFDNAMYMGNFGASMGNDFDGKVYKLDADGNPTDFVTSYLNTSGTTAYKGSSVPTEVTGFYDVIDLKFSPDNSDFGTYLFALSENIITDSDDQANDSDLWRISPDGTAQIFVENVIPAAGRMVFDTTGLFGNKLIIAPWGSSYQDSIITVDSTGTVETLYTISKNILDITQSPADSIFKGALLITYSDGELVALDYDPADGTTIRALSLAQDLDTGSIPGGNIIFDDNNIMYLLAADTKSVQKIDFTESVPSSIIDAEIQPVPATSTEDATYRVNLLLAAGDILPIIAISESETTSFTVTENGTDYNSEDTANTVGFCFSDEGNCYIYSNIGAFIKVSEWNSSSASFGSYNNLSSLNLASLAETSGHSYSEITGITVFPPTDDSANGFLYTINSNSIHNLPPDADTPSQMADDVILYLGNTTTESYSPDKAFSIDNFNSVYLTISGPGLDSDITETVPASEIFEYELNSLDNGTYTISIASNSKFTGDYELMVTNMGAFSEFIIDQDTPEKTFNLLNTETSQAQIVRVSMAGRGDVLISARINPATGNLIEIYEVEISNTNTRSIIDILNNDDPANLDINTITVNSSLKSLNCHGTVGTINSNASRAKIIRNLKLKTVENIDLPAFGLRTVIADNIGVIDPNDVNGVSDTKNTIDARYISSLQVNNDIYNMSVFNNSFSNIFRSFEVDGRMIGCDIYAKAILALTVRNNQGYDDAIYGSNIYPLKLIRSVTIDNGDLNNSLIKVTSGYIRLVELENGNIVNSTLNTTSYLLNVIVNSSEDQGNGNIQGNSRFYSSRGIRSMYLSGSFEKSAVISVPAATVSRVITGGNFSGTISTYRLGKLLVGYNQRGRRLTEDAEFTGSNYTGDITATLSISYISVTGQMLGDNSGTSTINSSYGSIRSILIEDGAVGYVSAGNAIGSIMIGTLGGNRHRVINDNADVSLNVSAKKLIRLYYTGTLDTSKTISGDPLIVDLNRNN